MVPWRLSCHFDSSETQCGVLLLLSDRSLEQRIRLCLLHQILDLLLLNRDPHALWTTRGPIHSIVFLRREVLSRVPFAILIVFAQFDTSRVFLLIASHHDMHCRYLCHWLFRFDWGLR